MAVNINSSLYDWASEGSQYLANVFWAVTNGGEGGSIAPTTVSKPWQFCSPYICMCLSEEILKAGGPFYLVSMPGEVNDPTHGVNV